MNKPIDWDLNSALIGCMTGLVVAILILMVAAVLAPDRSGDRISLGGYALLLAWVALAVDIVMVVVNL